MQQRLAAISVAWLCLLWFAVAWLSGCGVGLERPEGTHACVPYGEDTMRLFEQLGVREDVDACLGAWRDPCAGPHGERLPECMPDAGADGGSP